MSYQINNLNNSHQIKNIQNEENNPINELHEKINKIKNNRFYRFFNFISEKDQKSIITIASKIEINNIKNLEGCDLDKISEMYEFIINNNIKPQKNEQINPPIDFEKRLDEINSMLQVKELKAHIIKKEIDKLNTSSNKLEDIFQAQETYDLIVESNKNILTLLKNDLESLNSAISTATDQLSDADKAQLTLKNDLQQPIKDAVAILNKEGINLTTIKKAHEADSKITATLKEQTLSLKVKNFLQANLNNLKKTITNCLENMIDKHIADLNNPNVDLKNRYERADRAYKEISKFTNDNQITDINSKLEKFETYLDNATGELSRIEIVKTVIEKQIKNLNSATNSDKLQALFQAQEAYDLIVESKKNILSLLKKDLESLNTAISTATNQLSNPDKKQLTLKNDLQQQIKDAVATLNKKDINLTTIEKANKAHTSITNSLQAANLSDEVKDFLKNDLNNLTMSMCDCVINRIEDQLKILNQRDLDETKIENSNLELQNLKNLQNPKLQSAIKNDLAKLEEAINESRARLAFNQFNANYSKATVADTNFKTKYNKKCDYQFNLTMNRKTLNLQGKFNATTKEITAAGAFGRVFFGVDPDTNKKIAVKVVQKQTDQLWEALAKEASILLKMQGKDHVVGASEIGIQGDFMFVVMDEIQGEELFDSIENSSLRPEEQTSVFLDIARGLKEIHDAGIIHRDLKPENVMIDKKKKARVVDFGLSEFTKNNPNNCVGTFNYTAPEVFSTTQTQTTAVDVYSFGLLMYTTICRDYHELIKNREYIEIQNNIDINKKDYNYLGNSNLQKQLAELTTKCLKVNPEERITVEKLIKELEKITASQPKANP